MQRMGIDRSYKSLLSNTLHLVLVLKSAEFSQTGDYKALNRITLPDRDLELEVNEDDIEELIMGHKDELKIEKLQEILNEEHQETQ
ncbi:hypothetical protein TNCV_1863651 [Trichonephila clavipes]|nr:hypothetical protein TNCV_1863651 [Trichonephila clavipes]